MTNNPNEDFQYDSCVARGICSLNPRTSALQTVSVLFLRIFAKYAIHINSKNLTKETKNFLLETICLTIYNPGFNDLSFKYSINQFKQELSNITQKYPDLFKNSELDEEKNKLEELLKETTTIIQSIHYGEIIFNRALQKLSTDIRNLYNIILIISKSISLNLLYLESFDETYEEAFEIILNLLSKINIANINENILKEDIFSAVKIDNELMHRLRNAQEKKYGKQKEENISYSTEKGKSILIVGSNIRELETILNSLKEQDINIYTHDDMMLAHTFPKFKEYPHLKGQFGQGLENCLLDFASFPGPIILTKNSLHNVENFYRGRLFTTNHFSTQGIINIKNNDFTEVINSAKLSKGFKTGKQCETVTIGYNFQEKLDKIKSNLPKYDRIFLIGLDDYLIEQKVYFEKLIKLAPKNIMIITFLYNSDAENVFYMNACFDSFSLIRFYDEIKDKNIPITAFIPKCDKNAISQMIYLSENKNTEVYIGKCTPIILNPSLMKTLQDTFKIKNITSAKKDLDKIIHNS